jgi:hypothetical protein
MKYLTKKRMHKIKRRAVNRATRQARREAIGGNVGALPVSLKLGR